MTFANLDLHPKILKAISDAGYSEATPIQLKAIPEVMNGVDIRASAQTGTGKTAAFLLPALHRLAATPSTKKGNGPRILIIAPTRELAMQIATQAEKYSKHLAGVKTVCVVGGVPYNVQRRKLSRPYDVLIATPGRLIDFLGQDEINFSRVEMLVLDEADRMLDMGFLEPVEEIVAAAPPERQTLLFSATLQGEVIKLSKRLLNNPTEIVVHSDKEKHENIEQKLLYIDDLHHKNRLLDHILADDELGSAIVFTSTKRHADQLVEELYEKGHDAGALHGDMSQRQRTRTIKLLREGRIRVLVATDVAARGIDVQSITHVINFDLPRQAEDYVHRIGRTGRAGSTGIALSFAGGRDVDLVRQIEKFTSQKFDVAEIPGLEPRRKPNTSGPRQQGSHNSKFGAKKNFSKRDGNWGPRREANGNNNHSSKRDDNNWSPKRTSRDGSSWNTDRGPKRNSLDGNTWNREGGPKRSSKNGSSWNKEGGPRRDANNGNNWTPKHNSSGGNTWNREGGPKRDAKNGNNWAPKRNSTGGNVWNREDGPKRSSKNGNSWNKAGAPKRSAKGGSNWNSDQGPKRSAKSGNNWSPKRGSNQQFKSKAKSSEGRGSRPRKASV